MRSVPACMLLASLLANSPVQAKPKNANNEKAKVCGRLLGSGFCNQCGCKGGPGYRGQDKQCVGWDTIGKCGSPPSKNCKAERPHATIIPADWPANSPRQAPVGEDCKPIGGAASPNNGGVPKLAPVPTDIPAKKQ